MRLLWLSFFCLLCVSAIPLAEEKKGKLVRLKVTRSTSPPRGRDATPYKHPWYEYLSADIAIGSNLQSFLYDFSTTSADLTVNFCTEHPPADPATCFEPLNSTSYRSESDSIGSDFVSFGEYWNVSRQQFPKSHKGVNERGFFGVVGAGWPSLSAYGITPFWMNALKMEAQNMFGIFMSHDGTKNFLRFGGPLLPSECDVDNIRWHSLSSLSYWQFPVDGLLYGAFSAKGRQQAVMDTGSGWIGVPGRYLKRMMKSQNVSYSDSEGAYLVGCDDAPYLPPLDLAIEGKGYQILPMEYVDLRNPLPGNMCVVNLKDSRGAFGADWTFGIPFMQSYCTSYDYDNKRIGFADNLF
uniref:Peptidase A1 domain-containing protein n=1 Tax=Steinernema glaseri TaxID=37863 RepID=A0A1I8A059_9BILA